MWPLSPADTPPFCWTLNASAHKHTLVRLPKLHPFVNTTCLSGSESTVQERSVTAVVQPYVWVQRCTSVSHSAMVNTRPCARDGGGRWCRYSNWWINVSNHSLQSASHSFISRTWSCCQLLQLWFTPSHPFNHFDILPISNSCSLSLPPSFSRWSDPGTL